MARRFFDLEYRLRTDLTFANACQKAMHKMGDLLARAIREPKYKQAAQEASMEVLRLTNFNPIVFSKYFVPIMFEGLPLDFKRFPMAYYISNILPEYDLTVMGSRQISKCLSINNRIPMWGSNGMPLYRKDIKVGTKVLSFKDRERVEGTVVAIHNVGMKPVYRVTFRSGRSMVISDQHKLMKFSGWAEASTLKAGDKVAEIRTGGFFMGDSVRRDRIILTAYMLGDGYCVRKESLSFTKAKGEALSEFVSLAEQLQNAPVNVQSKKGSLAFSARIRKHNKLAEWLSEDGILGKHSWEKRIPDWVYNLNKEDTRLFLSRLWATDGSVKMYNATAQINYSSSSPELADGVKSLLSKFGILSTITTGIGKINGEDKRRYYTVRVKTRESWLTFKELFSDIPGKPTTCIVPAKTENNNDDVLPTDIFEVLNEIREACFNIPGAAFKPNKLKLQRSYNPSKSKLRRYLEHALKYVPDHPATEQLRFYLEDTTFAWCNVTSVEREPDEECWDIEVADYHNYALDGILSHNSTGVAYRFLTTGHLLRGYTSYYIVPHPEHLKTFARRFDDMYKGFRFKMTSKKTGEVDNLYYKKFKKGSSVSMFHVLEDDTKARGKTGDELVFDEYQNFDPDFHAVVDEILSASRWRIKLKLGTSLHTETALNASFEASSMGYWHIFCDKCGHENIPTREEGVLDMIQPQGPCCVKCGNDLQAEHGMYVHRRPEMLDREDPKIGIHVPQLFTPAVLDNRARWRAMYHKMVSTDSIDKFLQENVGLPTSQGLREITEADLRNICKENDGSTRKGCSHYQKLAASKKTYRFVLSGCDWGGSDHNRAAKKKISTTVHAMAGMLPDGTLELLHFRRYEAMNYEEIAGDIAENHKRYNGYALASDFGVGYYYNTKLREFIPANRHLIFQYAGPRTPVIKRPPESEMINHYMINKTETISMVYAAVKKRRILCFDWEQSQHYLIDFLQLFRNIMENDSGLSTFTWSSSPTKPNDTLQAVNYIHVLAKILRGEAVFEDAALGVEVQRALSGAGYTAGTIPGSAGAFSG